MTNELKYGSNEFVNQTKDSDEKAVQLIVYHDEMIYLHKAEEPLDDDYNLMYDRTHPLTLEALLLSAQVPNVLGKQKGQTKLVTSHLKSIKGKTGLAHDWYNRTAAIYASLDPPRMLAIWPKGLKPFNTKMDKVITALHTLSLNIGNDSNPLMLAIKAEVDAEYAIVNPGRNTQVYDKGAVVLKRKKLHAVCVLCMRMEYRNALRIGDKFDENIDHIQESFHDMELLLDKQQTKWDIGLAANETKDIAQRTQIPQSKFRAIITGGDGVMYLASTPGGTDSDFVVLTDGVEAKFTAAEFNVVNYGKNRHITVINSAGVATRFKLFLG